jgi:hypothetical protein
LAFFDPGAGCIDGARPERKADRYVLLGRDGELQRCGWTVIVGAAGEKIRKDFILVELGGSSPLGISVDSGSSVGYARLGTGHGKLWDLLYNSLHSGEVVVSDFDFFFFLWGIGLVAN